MNWSVNGAAGGNATFGQICVAGSNPCQVVSGSGASQVDDLAPGAIPSPNAFSIVASSADNSSMSASTQVTVVNHILVSVQPPGATLPPMGVQGFVAAVLGSTNQSVTWQIQGAGCGAAGACGVVDSAGTYTAPQTVPAPSNLQILAISQADGSQVGVANVSISGGLNILARGSCAIGSEQRAGYVVQECDDRSGVATDARLRGAKCRHLVYHANKTVRPCHFDRRGGVRMGEPQARKQTYRF